MAFDRQSSLWSLGGGLQNLLLSYISSGDGGLKAILNLREVCTTTKKWIEKLPTPQAEQILAKCQVEVDLHKVDQIDQATKEITHKNPFDLIRKFLETPPPAHIVNSLKLSGIKEFSAVRLSLEEEKLWTRFVLLWWGRLETLELDTVDNLLRPNRSRVKHLLSAPSLRHLHCGELEEHLDPVSLPPGLFYVEHISVDKLKLPTAWTTLFFDYLARTPKLKSFKLTVWDMENIEEITNFIILTKDKVNLKLTFTFEYCDVRPNSSNKQLPNSFVSAVAASSASIRLRALKLDGKQVQDVGELLETGTDFFKTVEWITEYEFEDPVDYLDNLIMDFPNLKRLGLKNFASELYNILNLFPPGLEEFTVEYGFPRQLPSSLTSLTIQSHQSSVTELLRSLVNLDKRCPLLKSLELEWKGDSNFEVSCACCSNGTISNHQDFNSTTPFRNLKRLRFSVEPLLPMNSHLLVASTPARPNVNAACWVLLNAFKLPTLSLLELDFGFRNSIPQRNSLLPELDRDALISLIRGNIAESLVRVKIDESLVTQDALPLKTALEMMAEQNGLKRRNLLGSKMYARSLNAET